MSVLGLNVVGIIQARMKSSRLPEKVMMPIAGKSMLEHVIERVRMAYLVDEVVVATTDGDDEDPIANLCDRLGTICVRGSLHDVLDRYHQAAQFSKADVIVRITSDCPLIDPTLIDETVQVLSGSDEKSPPNRFLSLKRENQYQICHGITHLPVCHPPGEGLFPLDWMWKPVRSRHWSKPGGSHPDLSTRARHALFIRGAGSV